MAARIPFADFLDFEFCSSDTPPPPPNLKAIPGAGTLDDDDGVTPEALFVASLAEGAVPSFLRRPVDVRDLRF